MAGKIYPIKYDKKHYAVMSNDIIKDIVSELSNSVCVDANTGVTDREKTKTTDINKLIIFFIFIMSFIFNIFFHFL